MKMNISYFSYQFSKFLWLFIYKYYIRIVVILCHHMKPCHWNMVIRWWGINNGFIFIFRLQIPRNILYILSFHWYYLFQTSSRIYCARIYIFWKRVDLENKNVKLLNFICSKIFFSCYVNCISVLLVFRKFRSLHCLTLIA
jgi:hypothetical protein